MIRYSIETINHGHIINKKWTYVETLNIGDVFVINKTKYKIKGIGVRTKQQPVTKEWYFDLSKDYITCLKLTNKDLERLVSFKYQKL